MLVECRLLAQIISCKIYYIVFFDMANGYDYGLKLFAIEQ